MAVNNFNSQEKILKYTDKLDYFLNGHKTLIVTEFDLTNRCNHKCPACCGINENGAELSKEQIGQIISGLAALENKGIIFSGGGDPLVSKHFEYAVGLARRNGMKMGINTNGTALDAEKARIIIDNFEYCRVSLDAATPELFLKTHGMPAAAFHKVVENIRMLCEIKAGRPDGCTVGTGFLTSPETIHEMEAFAKLSKDCGCDFAQFRPFTGDETDVTDEYLRLKEKYEDSSFSLRCSIQKYGKMNESEDRGYKKCHGMFFSTVITADAKVFICLQHRQNEKYMIGQIGEKSLEEIWRSARKYEVYETMNACDCPKYCRNDAFNRTLEMLGTRTAHSEFL